jgi:alcohol dehydrogenase, propanol-preferring
MPKQMKAAVVTRFHEPLVIEEMSIPEPGAGQVLVKIEASGVCHTDLHAAEGDWPVKPHPPFIPGHEGAGVVAAIGGGTHNGIKEGDRVGIPWLHSACGHCDYCVAGWETLCQTQQNSGYSVNGAFAQYSLASAAFVAHLPEKLSYADAAPVLCAGVTTYKGLKQTGVRPGEWVVISGIGGLGHLALQYAKAMGMHVAAVDVADDKLALARDLGAEVTANAKTEDATAKIQKLTGGTHGALVAAVNTAAFRQAIDMLRRGGTCVLCGLPPGDFPLPIFDVVLKGLTVRGSIVGTRNDIAESLAFAADGKVHAHYDVEPLEKVNNIFDRMRKGQIQGRVVMSLD